MAIFVTGATGFIGERLCRYYSRQGEQVVAFVRRTPESELVDLPNVEIRVGQLVGGSTDSLLDAMKGCTGCIHLAGLARQWVSDPNAYNLVNVEGTRNVVEAAVENKIRKMVFVSTAGVYGASPDGRHLHEDSPLPGKHRTEYERSKRLAEKVVLQAAADSNLQACIVCPTRVFGPGNLTEANSVTRIMYQYETGKWWMLPGSGKAVGNYVHVEDVFVGLARALSHGQSGDRYILGGENLSYRQLFDLIAANSSKSRQLTGIPYWAASVYAYAQVAKARITGVPPKLTPSFVRKYFCDYRFRFERTRETLGYQPRKIELAVKETMGWVRERLTETGGEI